MDVILHIGQHKTGSKALQSALHANRQHLAERSIAYPVEAGMAGPLRPYEMNHHRLFAAVRAAVDSGSHPDDLAVVRAMLDHLLASSPPGTTRLALSAEDLFDMHTAHEPAFEPARVAAASRLLARELTARGCRPRLVCYLRRQDHLLAAHYAQFIKGSGTHHLEFAEFRAAFTPRLDTEAILAHWEEAFGTAAVSVAAYEPRGMPGGIVADFFRRALDLEPPPITVPFPDDLEAFNITPSRDHLDYIRLLNRRASRGRPALSREYALESAFRDREIPAAGIAAWLSPRERLELLEPHEFGNQRIAARYGLGPTLFREPRPSTADPWAPHPRLDFNRLMELDARARSIAAARSCGAAAGRQRQPRVILWVISPRATAVDESAALAAFEFFAGCPRLESRVVPSLASEGVLRLWWRVAFVVLVGPQAGGWQAALNRWALVRGGAKVLKLPGPLPASLQAA